MLPKFKINHYYGFSYVLDGENHVYEGIYKGHTTRNIDGKEWRLLLMWNASGNSSIPEPMLRDIYELPNPRSLDVLTVCPSCKKEHKLRKENYDCVIPAEEFCRMTCPLNPSIHLVNRVESSNHLEDCNIREIWRYVTAG